MPGTEVRARGLWALFEPVHVTTYFGQHTRDAFRAAGLKGYWRCYFAARAAPLGLVPPSVITALFFGFAPRMVSAALPEVWSVLSPADALRVRREGAAATLEALPGWKHGDDLARAVTHARAAVAAAATDGRAIGAANAALPWPDDPTQSLWQAATTLRELRGDGHVTALLTFGLTGLDSVVLRAGLDVDPTVQQAARGWTDEEWLGKREDLRERGLLTAEGRTNEAGWSLLREVERVTNELAEQPWRALGPAATAEFRAAVQPFAEAATTTVPPTTPLGLITADGPWRRPPEDGSG